MPKRAWRARAAVHWERHAPRAAAAMPERASDSRTVDCTRAQCGRAVDRRSGLPELEGAPEARAVIEGSERCQNSRLAELPCGFCSPHAVHGATHAWPPMS